MSHIRNVQHHLWGQWLPMKPMKNTDLSHINSCQIHCTVKHTSATTSLNQYSIGGRCVANILICIGEGEEVVRLVKGPVCN